MTDGRRNRRRVGERNIVFAQRTQQQQKHQKRETECVWERAREQKEIATATEKKIYNKIPSGEWAASAGINDIIFEASFLEKKQ